MKLFQNWLVSDIGATKQLFPKWKKNNLSRYSNVLIRCKKKKKKIYSKVLHFEVNKFEYSKLTWNKNRVYVTMLVVKPLHVTGL